MKSFKRIIALLLAVMLMIPVSSLTAAAAVSSPTLKDLGTVATATAQTVTYNGKEQSAVVTVKLADGTVLTEGVDYVAEKVSAKSAGSYTVTITGMGHYNGTLTCIFEIEGTKAPTVTSTVKPADQSFASASLEKKAKTITVPVKASNGAKVTYTNTTKNAKIKNGIKVTKKGKITLKKGIKNGTYKVTVTVSAKGKYKTATKVITIKKTSKKVTVKVSKTKVKK